MSAIFTALLTALVKWGANRLGLMYAERDKLKAMQAEAYSAGWSAAVSALAKAREKEILNAPPVRDPVAAADALNSLMRGT